MVIRKKTIKKIILVKINQSAITGKRGPMDLQTLYAPVQGNTRAKKGQWVSRGLGGWWLWGTFGIALKM
jgi:hypothetical protein